jgi:hypothetical protein
MRGSRNGLRASGPRRWRGTQPLSIVHRRGRQDLDLIDYLGYALEALGYIFGVRSQRRACNLPHQSDHVAGHEEGKVIENAVIIIGQCDQLVPDFQRDPRFPGLAGHKSIIVILVMLCAEYGANNCTAETKLHALRSSPENFLHDLVGTQVPPVLSKTQAAGAAGFAPQSEPPTFP